MNILVTNDDGVASQGLWVLVDELARVGTVTVVAPDRQRSAIGTAVTLFEPLCAEEAESKVPGVRALAVDGTPGDCVILGLGKLIEEPVDIVVSGINPGLNLGEDVHISGTVGGALQGYFRGLPALAVSSLPGSAIGRATAARAAAILARQLAAVHPVKMFINLNAPDRASRDIEGVRITRLARASHINTVREDTDGEQTRYRLVRARLNETDDTATDIQAVESGELSLTPLYTSLLDKPPQRILKRLCAELEKELRGA